MNKEDKEDKEDEKENDEKKPEFTKENPSTIRKSGKCLFFNSFISPFICLSLLFINYLSSAFFLIYIIKQDICIYVAYSRPNG